MKDSHLI